MNVKPRILVLTLSFGSGHVRASQTIAKELKRLTPGAQVSVIDALEGCRWWFYALYAAPYWMMVRHFPRVWRRLFETRVRNRHSRTAPAWAFRVGCSQVFDAITRINPDVIVAVEVAACEMAAIAKREGLTAARLISVITDHEAEPVWVQQEVDAYAVSDEAVRDQLIVWGTADHKISVTGIAVDASFAKASLGRSRPSITHSKPLVLLMGGGMGPTRMDQVAQRLCESGVPMQIVAVAGHDRRMQKKLNQLRAEAPVSFRVVGWADDVAALMQAATLLITKPGGLTISEAALCGLPAVFFDALPGPEQRNAARLASGGAALITQGVEETVAAAISLLRDEQTRRDMSLKARRLASPDAATDIARIVLGNGYLPSDKSGGDADGLMIGITIDKTSARASEPTLILAISNGAGHIRAAEAIAEAIRADGGSAVVVDVADYMSRTARFTHVTAYLWLVKNAPRLWDRIDRYQKQQRQTSPDWYYRRGCRRLIQLVRELRPKALVATEVGCCEIAALIKRDLKLDVPLVAVNVNYDADHAWVTAEVDLYGAATEQVRAELIAFGAPHDRIVVWGVPMSAGFATLERDCARADVCRWLKLDPDDGLVLISGGGEGIGPIEEITRRLMQLESTPQIIVVTGKNQHLQRSVESLVNKNGHRVRVLGWTNQIAELMRASDVMVSKLGNTFDEAIVAELPIVALEPPPGSERVQYKLLDEWGVGSAVRSVDEMADTIARLLGHSTELEAMRERAQGRRLIGAADRFAQWLKIECDVAQGRQELSAASALVVNGTELLHLQHIEARSQ